MLLKHRLLSGLAIGLLAQPVVAHEHAPKVLASIQPLAILSAQVTGATKTNVILPPNRSPHHYQLKVSQRRAIGEADIIFWVGDNLEAFLSKAIKQYPEASLNFNSMIAIEDKAHHDEHGHDEHEHKEHQHDHDEHGHGEDHEEHHKDDHKGHQDEHHEHHKDKHHDHDGEHEAHDDHNDHAKADEHGHDDEHHHDHSGPDPHIWLAPENLDAMATALAKRLSTIDPDNASRYETNLAKIRQELKATDADIQARLESIRNKPFIVLHPALHHFVEHYGLNQVDAIVSTPESGLSAKHLRELNQQTQVACVLGEMGENNQKAQALAKTLGAGFGELDILGREFKPEDGAGAIIEGIAGTLLDCME